MHFGRQHRSRHSILENQGPFPISKTITGIMSKESVHVAVIGAGISGVVTAGHLLATGIKVTVFERSNAAGGVW